jgi:hypothetical protein
MPFNDSSTIPTFYRFLVSRFLVFLALKVKPPATGHWSTTVRHPLWQVATATRKRTKDKWRKCLMENRLV